MKIRRRSRNDDVFTEEGANLTPSTVFWIKSLVILIVLIGYLFIGAVVFRELEQPAARTAADRFKNVLSKLEEDNECVDDNAVKDLMNIVTRAIGEDAYNPSFAKRLGLVDESNLEGHWTFESSFFFSFTVVTTIGYGTLAPQTRLGEFFCVLYAVFGITMVATLLFTIGEILQFICTRHSQAIKKLCSCVILSHPTIRKLLLIINGIIVAYILLALLPSVIFHYTQRWSYIVSNYFAVIALSTIGLGDFVPDFHDTVIQLRVLIRCLMDVYFFICMGLIAMLLNIVSRKQARVGITITRTVEHTAIWIRLQQQFNKSALDASAEEECAPRSIDQVDIGPTRKLSSTERWAMIRMSVDHSNDTHEALHRIRRRSQETRLRSLEDEEEECTPTSIDHVDIAPTRKLSSTERWARIRMSVDYSNDTHEALRRIRRRSEATRMRSLVDEEEVNGRNRITSLPGEPNTHSFYSA